MKILITGGAGFIGSSVADLLLLHGHNVHVIDNYETGKKENNSPNPHLSITEGTICDYNLVKDAFKSFMPEIVLHAAASYKNAENWGQDIETNIIGTVNIIRACKLIQVKKIIYLQTSLCYGINKKTEPVTENYPLFNGSYEGGSSYAISKTAGELYLELSNLKFISFRLANVYGPRNLSGPLPAFYKNLINNNSCTIANTRRDFIYINDVANLILKVISGKKESGYYNVSTGKDYSIKELYEIFLNYVNVHSIKAVEREISPDDVYNIILDSSLTKKDFDWRAETDLSEGVTQTIEWYKLNSLKETYTHLKNLH